MIKKMLMVLAVFQSVYSSNLTIEQEFNHLNDTIVVSINLNGFKNLYSFEMYVNFDTTKLKFIKAENGEIFKNHNTFSMAHKSINCNALLIGVLLIGNDSINEDGEISKLYFVGKSSVITITNPKILNSNLDVDSSYNNSYNINLLNNITKIRNNIIIKNKTIKKSVIVDLMGRKSVLHTKFRQIIVNK
jgi:hypothetical protein